MITRRDVFKEVVNPSEVEKMNDNKKVFVVVYKAVYMCVRLLLDVRTNQQKLAEKLGFKLVDDKKVKDPESGNTVIKDNDNIK